MDVNHTPLFVENAKIYSVISKLENILNILLEHKMPM